MCKWFRPLFPILLLAASAWGTTYTSSRGLKFDTVSGALLTTASPTLPVYVNSYGFTVDADGALVITVSGGASGTVTSVATTSPITGGPITTTGTIACATCITSSAPGVGLAHFAGSTQAVTSSAVDLSGADATGTMAAARMPALTGECTTSSGAVAVTCGTGIAHTGTDVNTSYQVTATHLAAALPVNQGGTGTVSTLTGLMRGNSSALSAAELSGVVLSSGSNATTPGKADVMQSSFFCSDAGANDTYTCSLSPAISAYVTGTHYRISANTANTGAATINLNSLGAKTIKKAAGGITTDLADNDIRAGQWVDLVYDGTNMEMQSLLGNAPSSTPSYPLTVAGTVNSGGIPYFSSTTVSTSSALLTANSPVLGGGAGSAPSTVAGLTFDGTHILTVSVAGGGAGTLALSGNTSGTATFAAPVIAGTPANAVLSSNYLALPNDAVPVYTAAGNTQAGMGFPGSNQVGIYSGNTLVYRVINNTGGGIDMPLSQGIRFYSGNAGGISGSGDTNLFRAAAGVVEAGDGTAANSKGSFLGSSFRSGGTKFTTDTGCGTVTSTTGGASAGSFVAQATGACTVVITMGDSDTATNGWNCSVNDRTTANLFRQTASSTTTATVSGTAVTSDVVSFSCMGY